MRGDGGPRWEEVWSLYAEATRGLKSFVDYERSWVHHLAPFFGGQPVMGTVAEDVDYYLELRRKERTRRPGNAGPPRENTLRNEVQVLRGLANWGLKEEIFQFHNLHTFEPPTGDSNGAACTETEVLRILGALGGHDACLAFVLLHMDWFLTRREALELRWEQIHFGRREVQVHGPAARLLPVFSERTAGLLATMRPDHGIGPVLPLHGRHLHRILGETCAPIGLARVGGEPIGSQLFVRTVRRRFADLRAPERVTASLTGRWSASLVRRTSSSGGELSEWSERYAAVYSSDSVPASAAAIGGAA